MNDPNLEKRVETLEQEVHLMKSVFDKLNQDKRPWWERNAGIFKDNELFDEAVKAGQAYRESLKEDNE